MEYLVHWKGYGAADDLWVPEKEAVGTTRHIAEFHKENPEAPKRIFSSHVCSLTFLTY